jgi:hypothetical protein
VPLPPVMVIQDALRVAVHEHPLPVVTPSVPVVRLDPTARLVGDTLWLQDVGAGGGGVVGGGGGGGEGAGAGNTNWLESVLGVEPPGPTADTLAS